MIPLKVSRDILSRVLVPNILHEIIIHSVPPWLDDWHDSWSIRNETLYNLLRVNKLFYAVATPLLYGTLKQAFPDHSARWWLKLRGGEQWSGHPFLNQGTKPELLAYTTTLKIGEHPARQCAFVKGSDGEDWIDNLDATALSLPNLHHLIVGGGAQNGCNGLVCPLTINMAPKVLTLHYPWNSRQPGPVDRTLITSLLRCPSRAWPSLRMPWANWERRPSISKCPTARRPWKR